MSEPESPDLHVCRRPIPWPKLAGFQTTMKPTRSHFGRETSFVTPGDGVQPAEAAREIGLSDRSGRRWRKRPEIIEAIRARLAEKHRHRQEHLASGMRKLRPGWLRWRAGEASGIGSRECLQSSHGRPSSCARWPNWRRDWRRLEERLANGGTKQWD